MQSVVVNLKDLPTEPERELVNKELDHSINNLRRLKNQYKKQEPNYFIDPTKGGKSKYVEYSRDMFTIDLGQPTCDTGTCVTVDEITKYRINPNVDDNWKPNEEMFTLNPRSNQLVSKWELDQKQQLKIFPHMYAANSQLAAEANRPWKGGIERGGVDFPIPMRFQLRYLQQPRYQGSQNIDYDIHVKSKADNRPIEYNLGEQYTTQNNDNYTGYHKNAPIRNDFLDVRRPPGSQRCNLQRGIVDRNLADHRLDRMFDKLHRNEIPMRDEIRRAARSAGVYDPPKSWLENQQCENQRKQQDDIMCQPLYWYRYKGVPRIGETVSTHDKPSETTRITGAAFPSAEAQKSSFFGLGPPLPPPNPELLSAVDSDLLARRKPTGNSKLDSIIAERDRAVPFDIIARHQGIKPPTGEQTQQNQQAGVLLTDHDWNIPGMRSPITDLPSTGSGGVEGFEVTSHSLGLSETKNTSAIRSEQQHLPEPHGKSNPINLITAKKQAQRRIEYQLAHLKRLLPLVRQKQVKAKDTSHMIDINKTTNNIAQIEKTIKQLELMHRLIEEEIKKIKLPSGSTGVPDVPENRMYKHFFGKVPFGVGSFYTEESFKGDKFELGYGIHDYPNVGGIGNNRLRSFIIPQNTVLYLYTKPGRQGVRIKYTGPARVTRLPPRYSRQVSCIEFVESTPPYEAVCYSGPVYQGSVVPLRIGFYDYPAIGGIGNNKLASFKLPEQLIMTIYSRPNKTGDKLTYIGPIELAHLPTGWTNNVSGIEIQIKSK